MPEIGEIARVVHYLKKHAVGRKIASVVAENDDIVYGKVGCSADAFKKAMTGKKIMDARQQGKYFWMVMDSPPHPLMHLGMTGWVKFSNDDASYYKPAKEDTAWPPRFMKFMLKLEGGKEEDREVAFVDPRRLARIRLLDCAGEDMRKTSPLKENGPDPVIDKDILTREWLQNKLRSKKVPVKALLLDQANISGVGNWVADEVLYQARIHPEQYSNTFSDEQIKTLHDSLINVCTIACETLSDQSLFPENWLMKHRWNKGKKDSNVLPNGDKIIHLKVGGRTSAVVPNVQKKTGPVAGDVEEEDAEGEEETKPKKAAARSRKAKADEQDDVENEPKPARKAPSNKKAKKEDEQSEPEQKPISKPKPKAKAKTPTKKAPVKAEEDSDDDDDEDIERAKDQRDKDRGQGAYKRISPEEESEADPVPVSKKRKALAAGGTKEKTPKKAKTVEKEAAPSSGTRRSSRK